MSFTRPTKAPPAYEDVYVQEGSDAKLVWTYSITTDRNELALANAVTWSTFIPQLTSDGSNRRGLIVEKRDGTRQNLGTIPSYLTGRISIEDQATLVISSVKTTDDNFYACQLSTTSLAAPVVRSLIRLTVTSKQCSYFHIALSTRADLSREQNVTLYHLGVVVGIAMRVEQMILH